MRIEFERPVFDILEFEPSIISVAAFFRSIRCVRMLLSYDIDLDLTDAKHQRLEVFIPAGGCLDILKDVESADKNNSIALKDIPVVIAAEFGSVDITHYLNMKGVDINKHKEYTNHPAMSACQNGHMDIVDFYLENVTYSDLVNRFTGNTLLHYACLGGHTDVALLILEGGI